MSEERIEVMEFLRKWKPYADLAPGNPARRGVTRLIETDDPAQRTAVLGRVSQLAKLQEIYTALGIRTPHPLDKSERFTELIHLSALEMARALRDGEQRAFLGLLQECFEFGRFLPEPRVTVTRQFLLSFLGMRIAGPGLKYSIYSNNTIFSLPGTTHDEMAQRFTKEGLGSGRPVGGGEIRRMDELEYFYDTATSAFGSTMKPDFVTDALRRWVRHSGGNDEKITLIYQKKIRSV